MGAWCVSTIQPTTSTQRVGGTEQPKPPSREAGQYLLGFSTPESVSNPGPAFLGCRETDDFCQTQQAPHKPTSTQSVGGKEQPKSPYMEAG